MFANDHPHMFSQAPPSPHTQNEKSRPGRRQKSLNCWSPSICCRLSSWAHTTLFQFLSMTTSSLSCNGMTITIIAFRMSRSQIAMKNGKYSTRKQLRSLDYFFLNWTWGAFIACIQCNEFPLYSSSKDISLARQ